MFVKMSHWLSAIILISGINAATFPSPSGPFNVTLSTAKLIDTHRKELHAPKPTPRELMVSMFRPTLISKCSPILVDYMEPITAKYQDTEFAQFGIPAGTFESLKLQVCKPTTVSVRCKSSENYPLVLFSPGLGRNRLLHNAMAQEISSFGYLVVTVDHPYDADIVVFPDNSTITAADIESDNEILRSLASRTKDISFVLNQLSRPSVVRKLLPDLIIDTSKVGIFGHSLGGATAAEVMLHDQRFVGGVNLDGTFFGKVVKEGLTRPFLIFAHDGKNRTTDPSWDTIWPKLTGWKKELELKGSAHGSFTDLPNALSVLGLAGSLPSEVEELLGSIDGARTLSIVGIYVRTFFDRVLKHENGVLLDRPSPEFPEVVFESM